MKKFHYVVEDVKNIYYSQLYYNRLPFSWLSKKVSYMLEKIINDKIYDIDNI